MNVSQTFGNAWQEYVNVCEKTYMAHKHRFANACARGGNDSNAIRNDSASISNDFATISHDFTAISHYSAKISQYF
jgi:hypothetical protein